MDTKDRIQIIDAIKGLAIISVILLHILPGIVLNYTYSSFHIGQAVPIFLFISFYLSFKGIKDRGDSLLNYFNKRRIGRLLKQVVFPYFIVVICQMIITLLRSDNALEISDICHIGGGRTRVLLSMGISSNMAYYSFRILIFKKV
jgi:peptidoglycan/LPS O-acetylase OafA/YrhL